MSLARDCVMSMRQVAGRFLGADGQKALAELEGPFLVARMAGQPPALIDLGKLASAHATYSLTIGRHQDCDLRLMLGDVSSKHVNIFRDSQGVWLLQDLKTTNGTWAGERLAPGATVPLSEAVLYSLAQVVELEYWTRLRLVNELVGRARNPNASRAQTNRRYANLRANSGQRAAKRPTSDPLDLMAFARRTHAMSEEEFSRSFPHPALVLLTSEVPLDSRSEDATQVGGELVATHNMKRLQFWPLITAESGNDLVLGRGEVVDISLRHASISRRHASLAYDQLLEQWSIDDLRSKNGIFIDGEPIRGQTMLSDELCLRFGLQILVQFMMPGAFCRFVKLYALSNQLA